MTSRGIGVGVGGGAGVAERAAAESVPVLEDNALSLAGPGLGIGARVTRYPAILLK